MSRPLTAIGSLIAGAAALAALASGAAFAQVEIKFADALPKSFSYFPATHEFKKVADEVAKHLTFTRHGRAAAVVVI